MEIKVNAVQKQGAMTEEVAVLASSTAFHVLTHRRPNGPQVRW